MIGGGGSGKTRLGIQLCESAEHRGWFAGFVTHGELTRFASQQNLGSWSWPKSTLIVVDYAAARAGVLRGWLLVLNAEIFATPACFGKIKCNSATLFATAIATLHL
jgi:hypothetical protein